MGDVTKISDALQTAMARLPVASPDELAAYETDKACTLRADRLDRSGITAAIPDADVDVVVRDELKATQALDLVQRWERSQATKRALGPKTIFALVGAMGVGKTVAAAWLIAHVGGSYVEAGELVRMHSAKWGDERKRFSRLISAGVLVVDEVGSTSEAKFALHDIVNRRQSRLTLVLGNVTKAAFVEGLDARTVDRLRACGHIHQVRGDSLREGSL